MQIRGRSTPVGESTHADPDSLEHTVARQLVHDQWRLHLKMIMMMNLNDDDDDDG